MPPSTWLRHIAILSALSMVTAGVVLASTARGQEEESGGLRDETPPPRNHTGNQSEPPRVSPAPPPASSSTPSLNQTSPPNRLDVDIWVETWFSRSIDIHKVLPDGEREGQAYVTRMYYNLSVEAYAKDPRPFQYTIWVGDSKVMQGTATWKLHWVTSIQQDLFNISVEITQDGKTRRAEWARVLGIPGEDAGIGGHAGQEGPAGPLTQEVPVGFIDRLTWKLIGASLVQMVAAFVIVGGIFLERVERLGWSRFR